MSKTGKLTALDLYKELKRLHGINIDIAKKFPDQVTQIDRFLNNDKTGLVSTVVDFMIHSATVSMKIETENDTLNNALQSWQSNTLNRNVNLDIPAGLRELSTEYFRERWRSSLLALKVIWGEEKFANQGTLIVPKKMWFLDGSSIITESNGALNTRKFFVRIDNKNTELKNGTTSSTFIRKPYTSWHKDKVTPYLIKRGTIFNALIKEAIVKKQSDVIEAIIPLILKLQAGNDELALQGMNVSEEAFKKLKDQIVNAKNNFEASKNFGDIIASLRHDVKLEYLIPDLSKIFDDKILKSTDRNLLSSLGLIEFQGFSSNRQEAILNPKVLIEEVVDAVKDWANLLEDVMFEMMERNKQAHPNLANGNIQVIPGMIKAFITEEMRSMLRSLYDRGILSKQNASEDIANLNFEVQVNRRKKEDERDLQKIMKPPIIQNLEQHEDVEMINDDNNLEDQDKKPGTPEADNFNNAILKYYARKHRKKDKDKKKKNQYSEFIIQTPEDLPEEIKKLPEPVQFMYFITYNTALDFQDKTPEEAEKMANEAIQDFVTSNKTKETVKKESKEKIQAIDSEPINPEIDYGNQDEIIAPFENIDELPDNVKNVLPVPAQMIWMNVFNSVFDETGDEERAIRSAWSQVSKKYEKVPNKQKWVKKAQLEDYKAEMSNYAYSLFTEIYTTAFDHCKSHNSSIKTALAIVEKACKKNKDGVWVKDKTLTKGDMEKLENPDYFTKIMDVEIKEKKLKLLDKLLKEDKEE